MNQKVNQLIDILREVNSEIESIEKIELSQELEVINLKKSVTKIIVNLNQLNSTNKNFTNQLSALVSEVSEKFFVQVNNLFSRYHPNPLEKYTSLNHIVQSLNDEMKRMEYLSLIQEKNVILVGGNGSGKSSFASYLKESMSSNIVVIPAQKFLFYHNNIGSLHLTDKKIINDLQKFNFIGCGKTQNHNDTFTLTRNLSELFSKLVTVVANHQVEQEHYLVSLNNLEVNSRKDTILFKLNHLWKSLIPDIIFEVDTMKRTLIPIKNGQKYSLNAMSDGEKAMLYYICHVFLAEENSFIVVDEPETFLNASNFNRLWDTLESYRVDCKFIYISHIIDFIVTRSNTDLLWCKSYSHPNEWEIKNLEFEGTISQEFPKDLLSEILGVRKPILFCEGKKDSLDYFVYTGIFREEVVVCPVEGHNQVIQYTRAYNNSPILNSNCAYGIIDADLMSDEQISGYEIDGIYTLPFNEIEMIFFTDEVMNNVLNNVFLPEDTDRKVTNFQTKFIELVNEEKNEIVQQKMKKYIDSQLSKYRTNNRQTSENMVMEIKEWLDGLNLPVLEENFLQELERIIEENAYDDLLKISPQKKSVSQGLANKLLDSAYEEKAKTRLKIDRELANQIRDKYFSHIVFE